MATANEPRRPTSSRIERLRRMIEDQKDDPDLFSPDLVSRTQADLATQRYKKKPEAGIHLKAIFSDLRMTVIEALEDGDKVVLRWRLRGTWTGELPFAPNLKPSGKAVDFTGINIYRFVGDRIVEKIGEFDGATFVRQGIGTLSPQACVEALTTVSRPPEERFNVATGFGPQV